MSTYHFQWRYVSRYIPELLEGAIVSLEIAAIAMIIGSLIGIVLAIAKDRGSKPIRAISICWIEIARNTPALFQVYLIYFGLGSLGILVDSYPALVFGIAYNISAYLAETFRGGLKAIPDTQMRAARSLGMTSYAAFRFVVLPQLIRVVFNTMTNYFVWAILMTSLGVIVGYNHDLTGVTQEINNKTYRTFEIFAYAAIIYYAMCRIVTIAARLLARRLFAY